MILDKSKMAYLLLNTYQQQRIVRKKGEFIMAITHESEIRKINEKFKFYGICVNCMHDVECVERQEPERPILFCERHDVITSTPGKSAVKAGKLEVKEYDNNFLGLCKNCDDSQNCLYPKPESGIWHCEDYQ